MQINLKQVEIEQALKKFLAGQGIAIQGKTVEIAFTAGRGASGLSAVVSVEDIGVPSFSEAITDEAVIVPQPVLKVVDSAVVKAVEPVAVAKVEAAPAVEAKAEVPAAKTSSLFS